METVVTAALSGLVCIVVTGGTIWVVAIRNQLTKKDHEVICDAKQSLVFEKLENIKEQQSRMDEKLDRLLFNNKPFATTAGRGPIGG